VRRNIRAFAASAALLLISLLAAYLIVELGLRFLLYGSVRLPGAGYARMLIKPDPVVGWVMQPNQLAHRESLDYSVLVRSNSRGFNDTEYPYEKPEGVFRIVVLGDSFMEASHVGIGEGFADVLEAELRDRHVEVINLGIGAFGNVQQYLLLEHEALHYDPDLILLAFYGENDLHDNFRPLSEPMWGADSWRVFARPYATWDEDTGEVVFEPPDYELAQEMHAQMLAYREPFWERIPLLETSIISRVWRQFTRSLKTRVFTPGDDPNIAFGAQLVRFNPELAKRGNRCHADYETLWADARHLTNEVLRMIASRAEEAGARFALFTVPSKAQAEPRYFQALRDKFEGLEFDLERTERDIVALGEEAGFPVLDLVPLFRQEVEFLGRPLHYSREDSHWNPEGHRFAALTVLDWLIELEMVP